MAKEKENKNIQELNRLSSALHKSKDEFSIRSEKLEKANIRIEHLNTELQSTRSQLAELRFTKDENLTLKKAILSLENTQKVIIRITTYMH
mgnify:CR=1 FL=1